MLIEYNDSLLLCPPVDFPRIICLILGMIDARVRKEKKKQSTFSHMIPSGQPLIFDQNLAYQLYERKQGIALHDMRPDRDDLVI